MSTPAEWTDADLLRPVITEADDVVGVQRPWHPYGCLMVLFFGDLLISGGGIGGGLLLAWNWRRMGRARDAWMAAALFGVLLLAIEAFLLYLFKTGHPWFERENQRVVRLVLRAIQVVAGLLVAQPQIRRFKVVTAVGHEPASVFLPGIAAAVAGAAVAYGTLFVLAVASALVGLTT